MSLLISVRTDLIKLRRSAALWLSVLGAGMIPFIFLLGMLFKPSGFANRYQDHAWEGHLSQGWQAFASFLLPMFVILISSLVTQIEYKNNTWKQVFASPQTLSSIFLAKYICIGLMVLLLIILFNIFLLGAGWLAGLVHPQILFAKSYLPWNWLLITTVKALLALLAIISIQYWFSLRFRNFIVAIGLGLGLLIISMVAMNWEHVDKIPYAFPFLAFGNSVAELTGGEASSANFLWYSLVYFIGFTLLAFLDMRFRKERG